MFRNPLGYACLDLEHLHKLMGHVKLKKMTPEFAFKVRSVAEDLKTRFDVPIGDKIAKGVYSGNFYVPPLQGEFIDEHFEFMAGELVKKAQPGIDFLLRKPPYHFAEVHFTENGIRYKHNTQKFFRSHPPQEDDECLLIPNAASMRHFCRPFWTRFEWDFDNDKWLVTYPKHPIEPGFYFDTETLVKGSDFAMPVMASAVTPRASYMWLHPAMLDPHAGYGYDYATGRIDPYKSPMPDVGEGKVIVAHNAAYDACRVPQRYIWSNTPINFFICTMSMHQVVAGLNDKQRKIYNAEFAKSAPFRTKGSPKGLIDSYNFNIARKFGDWPPLEKADKRIRDAFVDADFIGDLTKQFDELAPYSLKDSVYGLQDFQAMWEKYREIAPSDVVLASHFLLSHSLIPVDEGWFEWVNKVDRKVAEEEKRQMDLFIGMAQEAHEFWQNGGDVESDPWLSQLDWAIEGVQLEEGVHERNERREFKEFHTVEDFIKAGVKPVAAWFKASQGGKTLTAKKVDAHHLLKLSCKHSDGEYYPVTKTKELGWCYADSDGVYHRVPHKTGDLTKNVGMLITNDYLLYLKDGRLKSNA